MSDNWVVQNLQNALETWNEKLAEIWQLIYLHTDSEKDVQVLRERFLEWKYRNACKLNGKY